MQYQSVGIGALVLALATPASAQETAAPGSPAVADIIVTAQHRAESVQKIPLAVTVLSSDLLERENIDTVNRLQTLVPGLKIIEIGVQPSIFIRGIGGVIANVLGDPAATYNFDGVAISRPISINGLFFDLDRVEVLKGPQGTLYGGNSTVGAINVLSRRPIFDLGGSAGVTLGNYNTRKFEGVLNVPVSDTFALRASFQTNTHDGYLSNGSNDAKDVGVRVKALYQPSSDFDALLTGTYFHSGGFGPGDVPLKSASGSFLDPHHPWHVGVGPDLDNGALTVPNDGHQNLRTYTINGQINWRTPMGRLTVIPSYIKTNYHARELSGGFAKQYDQTNREESIEARLSSNDDSGGKLKWQLGGLYQNIKQTNITTQHVSGAPGPELYSLNNLLPLTKSWGIFGQSTYSITDALRITGGLRYTHDHKTVSGMSDTVIGSPNGPSIGAYPTNGEGKWRNVDYRIGFDYDVTPTSLFYGNISTGYKVGGINPGISPNTYKPEHLTSFQLGAKNSFFDRHLLFNLEAWYWNYRDFQLQQFVPINTPTGPNADFGSANARKAKNYGLESQIVWVVTSSDRLTLNLQYDIAKYVDLTQTTVFPVFSTANYDGQTVNFAPKYSGNVMYEHTFDLGSAGHVVASVNDQYTSPINIVLQKTPGQRVGSTNVTDLQLTYYAPGDQWQIGAYVENLQNEPVIVFAGVTPAGLWGHPRAPRTFGARASAKF